MPTRRYNPRLQGERAECAFLWRCLERALVVSKPLWDSAPYDFVVEAVSRPLAGVRHTKLSRVQVKSVGAMIRREYKISTHGARNRAYGNDELDFFAAWIAPLDAWYIIPARAVLPAKSAALYPHVEGSCGKYEKYREAWHLLR